MLPNRTKNGQFKKGFSGNPGGRPKLPDAVKDILKPATVEAAKLLVELMNDPSLDSKLRLQCAQSVIERIYGKAAGQAETGQAAEIQIVVSDEVRELMG